MVGKLGLNGDLRNDWRKRTMTNDTRPGRGSDAILEFYTRAMQGGAKLELTGPVRLAGDAAAFPFTANVAAASIAIDIIDVFRFAADGKILSMQAFWGPGNVRTV